MMSGVKETVHVTKPNVLNGETSYQRKKKKEDRKKENEKKMKDKRRNK